MVNAFTAMLCAVAIAVTAYGMSIKWAELPVYLEGVE